MTLNDLEPPKKGFSVNFSHAAHNSTSAELRQKAEDRPRIQIWGKAQHESARCPKSNWGKIRGGGKISPAPKSRGLNSNALAFRV